MMKPSIQNVETFNIDEIHIQQIRNLPEIYIKGEFEKLGATPISKDKNKKVISYFDEDIWDLSSFNSGLGSDISMKTFNFSSIDDSFFLKIQTKFIVIGWLYCKPEKNGKQAKLSTLCNRFKNLLITLKFLKLKKLTDLNALNINTNWESYLAFIRESKYAPTTIVHILIALNSIRYIERWLPFDFKLQEFNITKLSNSLCSKSKINTVNQTIAIPQRLMNHIYGEAISIVEQGWVHRERLHLLMEDLQKNYNLGRDKLLKKLKAKSLNRTQLNKVANFIPVKYSDIFKKHLDGIDLWDGQCNGTYWISSWFSKFQIACFIVCGAFSGMRMSELFQLTSKSFYKLTEGDKEFSILKGYTLKSISNRKKETEWLTSPISEKAIELAECLSRSLRRQLDSAQTGDIGVEESECLWLSQASRRNPPVVITAGDINRRLEGFCKLIDARLIKDDLEELFLINPHIHEYLNNKLSVGTVWPLRSHQFRRSFAVFTVRNNLGNTTSLKQQFKHLKLRMTEWYGNGSVDSKIGSVLKDSELSKMIDNAENEFITSQFNSWFNSDTQLSGGFGKSIMAARKDLPILYSSWDSVNQLVNQKRLTLNGTMHSYCKNEYNCDMEGVVNPAFCSGCKHSVIDSEKMLWWKRKHEALTEYIDGLEQISKNEYSHFITQIRAAENIMNDFRVDFDKFIKTPKEINS